MKDRLDVFRNGFRQNMTRNILLILVFFALCGYAYVINFSTVVPASKLLNVDTDTFSDTNTQDILMTNGSEVSQTITAKGDFFAFQLDFSAADATYDGNVQVSLIDKQTDSIIYHKTMPIRELGTDSVKPFYLDDPISGAEGNKYKIIVTTDGQLTKEDQISLRSSSVDTYDGGQCSIDGVKTEGDLHFKIYSSDNQFLLPLYWCAVIFVLAAYLTLIYFLLMRRLRLEHMFVVSVLSIGVLYCILMTPLSIPDEPAHFDTAYQYSNMFLFEGAAKDENHIMMRSDDIDFLKNFTRHPNINEYKYITRNITSNVKDDTMESTKAQLVNTTPYVYFPAAIGIMIGRLLGLGSSAVFYFGRFANLAFFAVAGFFSIRKMPFAKMIFFVVSLLPMTIQQVSSYSYDAVVFGLAFLFISNCLHAAYSDIDLRKRDIVVLCILGGLLAPAKAVYVCICLLVFLIPIKRFSMLKMHGNKKAKCLTAILASSFGSFLAFNLFNIIMTYVRAETNVLPYGTEPGYTLSYLLMHPGRLFLIVRMTILNESSYFLESMLGKYLGWLDIEVSGIIIYSFFALLILSSIKIDSEKINLTKKNKIWLAVIVGSVFALVCGVMLLSFTPMSTIMILGVQGRYFLPVLPLALLFFRTDRIVVKRDIEQLMIFSVWILQILTIAHLFQWVLLQALVV